MVLDDKRLTRERKAFITKTLKKNFFRNEIPAEDKDDFDKAVAWAKTGQFGFWNKILANIMTYETE